MHSTLNDKELIIQCLQDQYKTKNVLVETILLQSGINTLHEYNNNVFYFGRLTIGREIVKIQFHASPNEYLTPEFNTQYDIFFRRLETNVFNTACQFYGYKFILIDK